MKRLTFILAVILLPVFLKAQAPYTVRPVWVGTINAQSSMDPSIYNWQRGSTTTQNINLYLPHATHNYHCTLLPIQKY